MKTAQAAPVEDEALSDGRRMRSADSRRRIVQALLSLVEEGHLEPGAEAVAERAGVGLRSVFRHFKDMEGLRREINEAVETKLRAIIDQPLAGDTPEARLEALIDRRADVFEQIMPYRRAGNIQRHRSALIQDKSAEMTRVLRKVLKSVAPTDLDADLLEAIDLVMSLDSWIRMRVDQGLTPQRAHEVMRRAVRALVRGY